MIFPVPVSESLCCRQDLSSLRDACSEASTLLSRTAVCAAVQSAVKEGLRQVFGQDWLTTRLAVRSSAAGQLGGFFLCISVLESGGP